MAYTADLLRWLQRKRYQYEVTFSLYMLTPTEKFVFNSFLFIFLSMIIIAASLYLPEHITTIFYRAWFYYAGDGATTQRAAQKSELRGQGPKVGGASVQGREVMDLLEAL